MGLCLNLSKSKCIVRTEAFPWDQTIVIRIAIVPHVRWLGIMFARAYEAAAVPAKFKIRGNVIAGMRLMLSHKVILVHQWA